MINILKRMYFLLEKEKNKEKEPITKTRPGILFFTANLNANMTGKFKGYHAYRHTAK